MDESNVNPSPPRRAVPLAELVEACLAGASQRRGLAQLRLLTQWSLLAGPRLAAVSWPVEARWPRAGKGGGGSDHRRDDGAAVLVVAVERTLALEARYGEPALMARINAALGWAAVGSIHWQPVPPRRPAPLPPPALSRSPAPAERKSLEEAVAGVRDDGLRAALLDLGLAMAARRPFPSASRESRSPDVANPSGLPQE